MAAIGRYERNTNIWPGFVDALATLLMVIIFLLLIFVLAQFFLGQALSGRDSALRKLESQVTELADLLALEKRATKNLQTNLSQMAQELQASVTARDDLKAGLRAMTAKAEGTQAKLDETFAQMLADKEKIEQQALSVASLSNDVAALSALREELQSEVRKLAARASALETSVADEKKARADAENTLEGTRAKLTETESELAASKDTLTVTLDELEAARRARETSEAGLDAARKTLLAEKELSSSARAQVALLNQQMAVLREQLARLETALDISEKLTREQKTKIVNLGKRLNAALASKVQELSRYRSEFFGRLREVLGRQPGVKIVGDRFVFQSEVLFEKGSADIGAAGKKQLSALAATLKGLAARIPQGIDWVLRVDGHTDSDPIRTPRFPSNWELSSARAIAVVRQLVVDGLPPNRLVAAGFGEFQPIDQRDDEIGKRRNRRIELKLTQR
ncbi:MAG: peptidoglycan -binding protein [Magnetovibrio sp.]|nr:peptidoglycan -binding protein [Magnetovibrio sp.]